MEAGDVIAAGQLAVHPLAEVVYEVANARLSGAIRLVRERVKAVVYFEWGEIIFAVSNLRQHRLTECAREGQFATPTQLAAVPAKATEVELGYALVERGILTTEKLEKLFELMSVEVLRHVLQWTDGDWVFDARVRLAQSARARVMVQPVLIEAARHLPPEFVSSRITNLKRQIAPIPAALNALPLSSMEGFVLARATGMMQLTELADAVALPQPDFLRSVYGLTLGGFLNGSLWPAALDPSQIAKAKVLTAQTRRPAASTDSAIGRPTIASRPAADTPPRTGEGALPKPDAPAASPAADRRAAEGYVLRVENAQDYYDVLGIGRASDDDEIKRAYYEIAKRFHPDRFHQDQGSKFHLKLQSSFARVSQAYDNLRDTKLRAAHDRKFEGTAAAAAGTADPLKADPNAGTLRQQAETRFQQGLAALQNGNAKSALVLCAQAAKMFPTEARYRAGYGQALAQDKEKRHQAEAELKEAVRIEPKNATFLIILGEFYGDQGYTLRAIAEFERALALDPDNVIAQRRLTDLQM
jgi:curved DNA-binding protein CbpA